MPTILIELPGGEGVVRRDDGEIVVTDDVSNCRGPVLRRGGQRPGRAWVDQDRSVVGGLLPAGAVKAEVVDDLAMRIAAEVGRGAYAAIVDQSMAAYRREPVVCCRDEGRVPVRWPLPADYPIVSVDDATEPCPACGAVNWEEYVPTESWRSGRPGPDGRIIPNPIVVCRVCGHEEPEGTFFYGVHASLEETEDEAARETRLARVLAGQRAQRWYSDTMTLRAVTFPIYAAEGRPAIVGTQRSRGDQLVTLTISHHDRPDADFYSGDRPRIEITTSIDDPYRGEPREAEAILSSWLQHASNWLQHASDWPDASDAARTLWHAARRRETSPQSPCGDPLRDAHCHRRHASTLPNTEQPDRSLGRHPPTQRPHDHRRRPRSRPHDHHDRTDRQSRSPPPWSRTRGTVRNRG